MMLGPAAMAEDDGPMDPKDKEEADKLEAVSFFCHIKRF
jgi:hypothetical protein